MNARLVKRILPPIIPYITIGIGLLVFHNAWLAILGYHTGMVAVISLSKTGIAIKRAFQGNSYWIPFIAALAGAVGGILLYILLPLLSVPDDINSYIRSIGLNEQTWPMFLAYFVLINPLIEEYYWRGCLGGDAKGKDPSTCFIEIATAEGPPTFAYFQEISDQINIDIMPHDYVFTASDAMLDLGFFKAHPRFYGTFPRKIRNYALDGKLMTLNDAIRSMTSLPADKFKMKGRGRIMVGNFADIVVIDLKTIREVGTYQDPAQYPEGIIHVLVNGIVSIENGKATGETGGRALRK